MATLCKLAIQEDWRDLEEQLANQLALPEHLYLETHPKDVLGDFAASLAAHRLAGEHWQEFAPLLDDPRPQVRRRAAQIVRATRNPLILTRLDQLRHDPDAGIREWYSRHVAPQRGPAVVVYSLGKFEVTIDGRALQLRNAGTRKARVLFGILLLSGEHGVGSADLALLLWPDQGEQSRRAALQTTISVLRSALKSALGHEPTIVFNAHNRRYALQLRTGDLWWDWDQLRRLAELARREGGGVRARQDAEALYRDGCMEDLLDLLPKPRRLQADTLAQWNAIHDTITELAEEHEAQAAVWMQQIGEATATRRS